MKLDHQTAVAPPSALPKTERKIRNIEQRKERRKQLKRSQADDELVGTAPDG